MSGDDIGIINTTTTVVASAASIGSQNGDLDWEDLLSKTLTLSDVTKPQKRNTTTNNNISRRLIVPKQQAEKFFGSLQLDAGCEENSGDSSGIGKILKFEDELGQEWKFRYTFWKSSQSYVLTRGWSRYVNEKGLRDGDTVFFKRHRRDSNRLLIERNHSVSQATAGGQRLEVATGILKKTEQTSKVHLKRKRVPPTGNNTLGCHNLDSKDSENITTVGSPVDKVPEVVPSCNVPVDDPTIPKETIPVSGANSDDKSKDNSGGDFSNLICSSAALNFASAGGDSPLLSEAEIHDQVDEWIVSPGNACEPDTKVPPESNIDALNASPAKHQLSEISPMNLEPNLSLTTPPINSGDEAFTNSNNKPLSKASSLEQQRLEFSSSNYETNLSSMRSPASFGYELNINSNNNSFSKDSFATPQLLEIFPPNVQTDLRLNASTDSNDKFFSKGTDPAAASPAKHQRNLEPNLSLATPSVSSADKDNFTSSNNNFVANTLLVTDHSMESERKQRHHELAKSMDSLISSVGDELSSYCEKYKSRDPEFALQLESRPKVFQNFAIQSVGIIMKIFCETSVDQSLMEEHRSVIESHWEHLHSSTLDLPELGKLVAASNKLSPYEEAHGEVCRAIQSLETIKKDMESTPLLLMDFESKLQEASIAIENGRNRIKRIKPSPWIDALEY